MRAVGRLLRLSLAPSAAADVACGVVLGSGGRWPGGSAPWLLIAASLGVYHGALALNDWADREHDARTRPDRPIPSGRVPARAAFALALVLTAAGVACAALAGGTAGLFTLALAAAAWSYDLFGRGPVRGPLLLAACRAGSVTLGMLVFTCGAAPDGRPGDGAPYVLPPTDVAELVALLALLTVPLAYGAYVFLVSRVGRLEDGEDGTIGTRPRVLLTMAALVLFAPAFAPHPAAAWTGRALAFAVAAAGAYGLARAALADGEWTRARVGASMGLALRRLSVFTAAATLLAGTGTAALVAACILMGYPVSFALRRVFPPS